MAERPRLNTPTGAAMTQPRSPAQWHDYPFVWSWYVSLASLDTTFIEDRCREAESEDAPADAVYKTGPGNTPPNTWITVDQLSEDHRDRVRDYGNALLSWERELTTLRNKLVVHPLHTAALAVPSPADPREH
ncbi:hypothetical protein ACFWNT_45485 [Streptomyces sp. NPDC058409]|uniref:hypothetical protein n=1 Tax=Streptomyces sp. NPDC058409 TaxID=3346484 RepID=UPI00365DD782